MLVDALKSFLNLSSAGTWDKFGLRWAHLNVDVAVEQ